MSDAVLVPKVSLSNALSAIAEILAIAEEGGNTDEAIRECLALASDSLASSVDRRVFLVNILSGGTLSLDKPKGLIASLKAKEEAVYQERKRVEAILLRIKEFTMELMHQHGVTEILGNEGEFRIQAGADTLECDVPVYSKSYSNLVTVEDVAKFSIPPEYLTYETIATLDKEKIKKEGKVPWARLQSSKQIRMKQTPRTIK